VCRCGTTQVSSDANLGGSTGSVALNNGALTITEDVTINSGRTISTSTGGRSAIIGVAAGKTATFGGTVTSAADQAGFRVGSSANSGTLALTGTANNFTGPLAVLNGTLAVTKLDNAGVASSIGTGANGSNLNLGNTANTGALAYIGSSNSSTDRQILIGGGSSAGSTGGARINNNGTGALTFTNAAFNALATTATANRTLTLGGSNTGDNTISGVIADNAASAKIAVTKADAGKWILGGTNTYTGATLGGDGTAAGTVSVAGKLAPGNSIGTIDTGNLTLTSTGTLSIELGRDGGTPQSDRANVTGSVTLDSGANLELTLGAGLTNPALSDIFFLLSNDSADAVSGIFAKLNAVNTTLSEGSIFSWNSQSWEITYLADFGSSSFTGGNDIALQVVPEPATWLLLAGGLSTMLLLRRRRS